jgi:hypothetical protein
MGLVPLLSVVLLAVGLAALARGSHSVYRWVHSLREKGKGYPHPRLLPAAVMALLGLTVASMGTAGLSLVFAFSGYAPFAQKDLVAEVRCTPGDRPGEMILHYTPITSEGFRPKEIYHLTGDQWAIGGEIVKWRPFVAFLGARTLYKVSRIEGRYLRAQDALEGPRTAFDVNGGPDPALLRWNQREGRFPYSVVVEAAYGNLSYDFPQADAIYAIYVTPSGFQIEMHPYPAR